MILPQGIAISSRKFLRLVLIDAEREYDESSRIGFGMDGDAAARDQDLPPSAASSKKTAL